MELLLVLCLCISTWTGKTLADENDLQTRFAAQNDDVILPCSHGTDDLRQEVFDWKKNDSNEEVFFYEKGKYNKGNTVQHSNFRNRVDIFKDELEFGNASIRINSTRWKDSGIYKCTFPSFKKEFYIRLVVGQRPTLSIEKTANGRRVKCSVFGVSNIEMELHNLDDGTMNNHSSNEISQNTQYFMFSVTKQGNYSCVVKNKEDCYKFFSEKSFVEISDTRNRAEGGKKVKLILLLLLAMVGLLLP